LLFVNTLVVNRAEILAAARSYWRQILVTQFLIFLFFPVLLTAICESLVQDGDFVFGWALSTLAPCALVNPFFARVRGGGPALTLANVLVSTLLAPVLSLPMLHLVQQRQVFIDPKAIFFYLIVISLAPVVLSFLAQWIRPRLSLKILPAMPALNSFALAALMFILVGSSMNRLPSRQWLSADLGVLFALYLMMDFGLYALVRRAAGIFLDASDAESMALSVATRNFALIASLLLFFHPKAALPSAVGLIVHCLFFQWLMWRRSDPSPK
jgi:predicted Na+-dependent transporter